jgi:hypothetical protein
MVSAFFPSLAARGVVPALLAFVTAKSGRRALTRATRGLSDFPRW